MSITRYCRAIIRLSRPSSIIQASRTTTNLVRYHCFEYQRNFSSVFSKSPDYSTPDDGQQMDISIFEPICAETLEALTDYFEEIVEADDKLSKADVAYSDGVLTVKLGSGHGTYVINRQTPNRQIWLSSPTSGPKRYDYDNENWIYKHDGISLHQLLQSELEKIISNPIDFLKLVNKKK